MESIKGFLSGVGNAIGRGLNRGLNMIETSFLDASDQSIFFGSRKQREYMVGGMHQIGHGHQVLREGHRAHAHNMKLIRDARKGLDSSAPNYQAEIDRLNAEAKQSRRYLGEAYKQYAEEVIGGTADMIGSTSGYFAALDRQGEGLRRAGAIATRAGMATAVYGGTAVGIRYATGGDMMHNRKGERDIAGIPFA